MIDDEISGTVFMILKFADDTKMLHKVGKEEDIEKLKNDLTYLYSWSLVWQLVLFQWR